MLIFQPNILWFKSGKDLNFSSQLQYELLEVKYPIIKYIAETQAMFDDDNSQTMINYEM